MVEGQLMTWRTFGSRRIAGGSLSVSTSVSSILTETWKGRPGNFMGLAFGIIFCYSLRVHSFERVRNHDDHRSEDLQGVESNALMSAGNRLRLIMIVIAEFVASKGFEC
jgi:hypothetical protein